MIYSAAWTNRIEPLEYSPPADSLAVQQVVRIDQLDPDGAGTPCEARTLHRDAIPAEKREAGLDDRYYRARHDISAHCGGRLTGNDYKELGDIPRSPRAEIRDGFLQYVSARKRMEVRHMVNDADLLRVTSWVDP